MSVDKVFHIIDENVDAYVDQLKDFVRIPSISAGAGEDTSGYLAQAADFLEENLQHLGFEVNKIQVAADSNPLIVARNAELRPNRPTLLIYGHYDVQGVDNPRTAWDCDPFAALEKDGYLIGRGASDNKGPTFAHIKAVESILNSGFELPLNIIFLVEGEEECGSRALGRFVSDGGLEPFKPILCTAISDTSMYGPERPSLTVGLRGIVSVEVSICGPRQDVHSGLYGGITCNPNNLLIQSLSALEDPQGRIAIPGFYDDVESLSSREKSILGSLEADENLYREALGVPILKGEPGFSILERLWTRPTLDINYLSGGSPRTVIPARATAVLSCRLVPRQDPARIETAIRELIRSRVPEGIQVEFGPSHKSPPYLLDLDHPLIEPALKAIRSGFEIEPVLTREGGSIPIVTEIEAHSRAPVLLLGMGQSTDNWHGPNERFCLRDFHRGIRTSASLMYELSQL